MSQPCIQAPIIEKIDKKLDQVMDALQVLAVQKNEIDHLKTDHDSLRQWVKGHEVRLQVVELHPGKLAGKTIYLLAGIGCSVSAALIVLVLTR